MFHTHTQNWLFEFVMHRKKYLQVCHVSAILIGQTYCCLLVDECFDWTNTFSARFAAACERRRKEGVIASTRVRPLNKEMEGMLCWDLKTNLRPKWLTH